MQCLPFDLKLPLTLRVVEYEVEPAGFTTLHVYVPECL